MRRKKYSPTEIVIPKIPEGSKGDTLAGCAHRDLIGRIFPSNETEVSL